MIHRNVLNGKSSTLYILYLNRLFINETYLKIRKTREKFLTINFILILLRIWSLTIFIQLNIENKQLYLF